MEFEGKANQILISTIIETEKVAETVKKCLTPTDAGLQLKKIEATNEIEISTERVFLEDKISSTLNQLPDAELILTYFVNAMRRKAKVKWRREGKEAAVGSRQSSALQ
jgi:putative ABC transport system permease protein